MDAVGHNNLRAAAHMEDLVMMREFDFVETDLPGGLSVIEASAGTGKTYAISHLVPRFLLDGTAERLSDILLVTFTNDAARELAERVRRVIEKLAAEPAPDEARSEPGIHRLREKFGTAHVQAVAGRALLDLDLLSVSTIHSFCQKTLQTEGPLCGLPVIPELIENAAQLANECLTDHWENHVAKSEILSLLASQAGWQLSEDFGFLKMALSLPKFEPQPTPKDFEASFGELKDFVQKFTAANCEQARALVEQVVHWKQDAPPNATWLEMLATLEQATSLAQNGVFEALRQIGGIGELVNGTRHKLLKAELINTEVAQLGSEFADSLNALRWDFRNATFAHVRTQVAAVLASNRQITYEGLITTLAQALDGPHGPKLACRLRERYKILLVDESQDTDALQFEIFAKVFLGSDAHRLVLIGDPKQAIYAFRGADVNTYLRAKALAGSQIFSLRKTFRSPAPLVSTTNAIFSRPHSLLKSDLDFEPATSGVTGDVQLVVGMTPDPVRLECWIVPDEEIDLYSTADKRKERISSVVAGEIVRLLNAGARIVRSDGTGSVVKPGDFAVLVATHDQASVVVNALRERAVPAIQASGEDILQSAEASELLVVLRAMEDPRRAGLRLAALATRFFGCTAEQIHAIRESGAADVWLEKFLHWQGVWVREGIAAALAAMDASEHVTLRLAAMVSGERRITNLRQLTDVLEAASLDLGNRPSHLVRWLAQEIATNEESKERQQQLESDADAVQIVTKHSSKGMEYPLVFCPFLWYGKEPTGIQTLPRPGQSPLLIDTSLDATWNPLLAQANLEDRLRLAYVAITRAKVKVWIFGGQICGTRAPSPASALDWLLRKESLPPDFGAWRELAKTPGRGTRHTEGLEEIAAAGGTDGLLTWGPPPEPTDERWLSAHSSPSEPLVPMAAPEIPSPWGMTSFSALTREKNPHAATEMVPLADSDPCNPFTTAPGGAVMGTAVHDWMEAWDFSEPNPAALEAHFDRFRFPESDPLVFQRVAGMLEILRTAILPGMGCTIQAACPNPAASEWHFQLPIQSELSVSALASVFETHGHSGYASVLSALPVEELRGYLHGFLDRIAFHDGAWGVIDWKTNNLGGGSAAYSDDALTACAFQSHYFLQAHLYLVALRRFLGPDVRIAGAWLVFMRGVVPGSSQGVLTIAPEPALLSALDQLFAPRK